MVPKIQPHYRPVYMDFSLLHWLVQNTLNDGIWCHDGIWCQDGPVPVGGEGRCGVCWFMCTTLSSLTLLKKYSLAYRPACYTKAEISRLSASQIRNLNPVFGGSGPALTGLRNLGNTCYMNSILQCLCNAPHLAEYFNRNLYQADINR